MEIFSWLLRAMLVFIFALHVDVSYAFAFSTDKSEDINNTFSKDKQKDISNTDLVYECGKHGMGVDFVTGTCVDRKGKNANPYNLYPPFQSPFSKPDSDKSIMRCQGKAVDFVTGRCMD